MPLLRPPEWTRQAACAGHPLGPDAWDRGTLAARLVCAIDCPVQLACALEALEKAIPDTLRGGLDPDERTDIAARFGYDRPGLPQHGTRSRYGHRTQPCRCHLCREAMRRYVADVKARKGQHAAHGRPRRAADTAPAKVAA